MRLPRPAVSDEDERVSALDVVLDGLAVVGGHFAGSTLAIVRGAVVRDGAVAEACRERQACESLLVLLFGLAHRAGAARVDPLATSFAVKVPEQELPVLLARAVALGWLS